MIKDEYERRKAEITERARQEIYKLSVEYAISNSPAKVGDVVRDHYQTVKVDSISVTQSLSKYPYCVFKGPMLTKAGKPFKNGSVGSVHETNLKEVNGRNYNK